MSAESHQDSLSAPPFSLPLPSTPVGTAHPDVATQVAPTIQPDTDSSDEAYAESTTTSYVTSIASEISKGVLENDRIYPNYGKHSYGMPMDEDEMDRLDLQHRKYELVIGDKHFLAPIGPTPQRILDLGTGTGIWALDVADLYPSAEVIGVDIAPIQPKWVASNCQFEIDDVEEDWMYRKDSFDFIHFRDPLYSIRDWSKLMRQCFEHLKPGGWCEFACIYPVPMCDDGTMPENSGFTLVCAKFMEAGKIFGTPLDAAIHFATYLREAGFVDISENIFKIPASPWPKGKRLKQIGALEMTNVLEGAGAFGTRVFHQVFGWSKEQIELVLMDMRRDVRNRAYHQYCQ
jgi:SAM-dependent methyltransferase